MTKHYKLLGMRRLGNQLAGRFLPRRLGFRSVTGIQHPLQRSRRWSPPGRRRLVPGSKITDTVVRRATVHTMYLRGKAAEELACQKSLAVHCQASHKQKQKTPWRQHGKQVAPAKALEKPQSLRPADYFDPAELGMIRGWADFMANIIAMEPEHFFWAVRRDAEEKVSALASQIGVATSD